jgi:hypothetical protein
MRSLHEKISLVSNLIKAANEKLLEVDDSFVLHFNQPVIGGSQGTSLII